MSLSNHCHTFLSPPFGVVLKGRNWRTEEYRYGFNGKEKDDEFSVEDGSYDFGARMYDSRLGRWWSVDGKFKLLPDFSVYTFAVNSPMYFIDYDGDYIRPTNAETQSQLQSTLNRVFAKSPDILKRIKMQNIGTAQVTRRMTDGSGNTFQLDIPVNVFAWDNSDIDGKQMTITEASTMIRKNSEMTVEEKLEALAFLKAIDSPDVIEMQTPFLPEKGAGQNFDVISGNWKLSEATHDHNEITHNDDPADDSNADRLMVQADGFTPKYWVNENVPSNFQNNDGNQTDVPGIYTMSMSMDGENSSKFGRAVVDFLYMDQPNKEIFIREGATKYILNKDFTISKEQKE